MSKGSKNLIFYVIMVAVLGALMYLIIKGGEAQQLEGAITLAADAPHNLAEGFGVFQTLLMHHIHPADLPAVRVVVYEDRATYGHW